MAFSRFSRPWKLGAATLSALLLAAAPALTAPVASASPAGVAVIVPPTPGPNVPLNTPPSGPAAPAAPAGGQVAACAPGSASGVGAAAGLPRDPATNITVQGTSVRDRSFPGDLRISADHVTLSNVAITGRLVIAGSHVRVERVSVREIAVDGARDVRVTAARISQGRNGFSITSDPSRGRLAADITLERSHIDHRSAGGSSNGVLVRGARQVTVRCTTLFTDPAGNAAIKLEDTLGGTRDIALDANRLAGGKYRLRTSAADVRLTNTWFEGPLGRACLDDAAGAVREQGNEDAAGAVIACRQTRPESVRPPASGGLRPPVARVVTAASQCQMVPTRDNTGAKGPLQWSTLTALGDNAILKDAVVDSLVIRGRNVVVTNVEVKGTVLVIGDGALIDRVTAGGLTVSSASDVVVQFSKMVGTGNDGLHVTSDRGRHVQRVRMTHNFIGEPRTSKDTHYDGIQVRGATGLEISCSTFDAGPVSPNYNAGIYLEDANGGTRNVQIVGNLILGSSWSLMVNAPGTTLVGNRVGGDIRWGYCRVQRADRHPDSRDNVRAEDGAPVPLCAV